MSISMFLVAKIACPVVFCRQWLGNLGLEGQRRKFSVYQVWLITRESSKQGLHIVGKTIAALSPPAGLGLSPLKALAAESPWLASSLPQWPLQLPRDSPTRLCGHGVLRAGRKKARGHRSLPETPAQSRAWQEAAIPGNSQARASRLLGMSRHRWAPQPLRGRRGQAGLGTLKPSSLLLVYLTPSCWEEKAGWQGHQPGAGRRHGRRSGVGWEEAASLCGTEARVLAQTTDKPSPRVSHVVHDSVGPVEPVLWVRGRTGAANGSSKYSTSWCFGWDFCLASIKWKQINSS